jgi:tRNA pseudouridine55 synthase
MDTETECSDIPLPKDITEEQILEVRNSFLGEIEQTPPMYSAVKVGGKKLYNLARKGKTIKREPRKIIIEKFEISKIDLPDIYFTITCSKGTFIRVIADDFGKKLKTGGILLELRREAIGEFHVDDSFTINSFSNLFQPQLGSE